MYRNRLHAWWSTQSRLATLLSSLNARRWVGLLTLWRFRLKDLSFDEMVGAWCFGCLSSPPGFTCWISFAPVFSFIYCWVLIFALSPILIYIYCISWFIYSRRWCIDKLGVFHANQISMCLYPHLNLGWGWRLEIGLSPPVKVFLLTVPRRFFFFESFLLVMLHVDVHCAVVSVPCSLVVTFWELADLLNAVFIVFCHFPKCVLVHIRIKGEVGAVKLVLALQ